MTVKHAFTNPKADDGDATHARPSDWNAAHTGVIGAQTGDTAVNTGQSGSADINPASPGADDDEFDTTDTSDPMTGWTTFGTPTHDINSSAKSNYRITLGSNDSNLHGIGKTAPSMPFTMKAKLTSVSLRANSQETGIFIAEAGLAGKIYFIGTAHTGVAEVTDLQLWTNRTTFSTQPATVNGGPQPPCYFRIDAHSSTNVDFYYGDGGGLSWRLLGSAVNPGFTIGAVGIFVTNQNGTYLIEAFWDWVRFT